MDLLYFFVRIGLLINDLLAIFSVVSGLVLLFGSVSHRDLGSYSILGLIFGLVFQASFYLTGYIPLTIGALLGLPTLVVNVMFGASLIMVLIWRIFRSGE